MFFAAGIIGSAFLFAENPASVIKMLPFDLSLLWSGSFEESGSDPSVFALYNRAEIKLSFLRPGLTLRGQVLDRHTADFEAFGQDEFKWEDFWVNPNKAVTNYTGGFYHKPTGSRLLYGVLDEYGLSARIRNPWIRSPPYAENHKPLMADLKTAASGTKEDEAYLYLSTPFFNILGNVKLRGFSSVQAGFTDTGGWHELKPALSGGVDMVFSKNTGLLLETFYTGAALPKKNSSSWFSYPPPLPERDFDLYSFGVLFYTPFMSVSSDWAWSQTFAWGTDVYGNFGVCFTPLLPFLKKTRIPRPLSVSFAIDGAGERFVYRDGADHGEGLRGAGKIEWKGGRSSLFRMNTVLRGPGLGESFNRSSSGIYYRFPSQNKKKEVFPARLTRVSLSMNRNAVNPAKINDELSANLGISLKWPIKNPLGINLTSSVNALTMTDDVPFPYPVPEKSAENDGWVFDSADVSCEIVWSPLIFSFKFKFGYFAYAQKDDKFNISLSAAARFKYGRLNLKVNSPEFPEKWNLSVYWKLEMH